jgi:hypothetical protein
MRFALAACVFLSSLASADECRPLPPDKRMELKVRGPLNAQELVDMWSAITCQSFVVPSRLGRRSVAIEAGYLTRREIDQRVRAALRAAGIAIEPVRAFKLVGTGDGPPPESPPEETSPSAGAGAGRETSRAAGAQVTEADLDAGITCAAPGRCTITRALVDQLLADVSSLAKSARFVPSIHDGKPNGFKLYAIRPASVFAKLGFRNGDTLKTVNALDLSTPDRALEVYTKLRDAQSLLIGVERLGEPIVLEISVR